MEEPAYSTAMTYEVVILSEVPLLRNGAEGSAVAFFKTSFAANCLHFE
jgi:hypothetical protein